MEPSTVYATTIPFVLFASFQLMFAAITPALITGAFAERKRFGSFVLFTILWSILIYSPLAHWVWSVDGWLFKLGALDFAGGTVVHISSGVSALVVALMIGRRARQRRQHGAARRPDDRARRRAAVVRLVRLQRRLRGRRRRPRRQRLHGHEHRRRGRDDHLGPRQLPAHTRKVSVVGAACGAVAGLVAITPASGYVTVGGALIIGLVAGGLCYSATLLRARSRVDDALDVFAVHGVGGMFGAIATGVFASSTIQAAYSGLLEGNPQQLVNQLIAVGGTVALRGRRHRSSSSRSSTSCSASGSSPRPRRWASTCRSTARPPIRPDAGARRSPGPPSPPPPAAVDHSDGGRSSPSGVRP